MEQIQEISDTQSLKSGDIIRRLSATRHHQGVFVKMDAEGGLIVCDVVDLKECSFLAEAAVIRPTPEDQIFLVNSRFGKSERTDEARNIVLNWSLYRDHPELQKGIVSFVENVYSPDQIVELGKAGNLRDLFVPIQQKFRIGKFKEKIDWEKIREDRFRDALEPLSEGGHMTYVAFIPGEQNHKPVFYTIGTKPHQETITELGREQFAFKPTHAGHLKLLKTADEGKHFVVDSGSNFLGAGIHTSLSTAEMVSKALTELFPNYEFTAMAGRGAFGAGQSY